MNFNTDALPWFYGLYHGRKQSSDLRVALVEPPLLMCVKDRLIKAYQCDLLCRNEVLVQLDRRGRKLLGKDSAGTRIQFEPETGCDDDSLLLYFNKCTLLTVEEIEQKLSKCNTLDMFLNSN